MTKTSPKILMFLMVLYIITNRMIGPSRGRVMAKNCRTREAPSILLTSYSSWGMAVSPARNITT